MVAISLITLVQSRAGSSHKRLQQPRVPRNPDRSGFDNGVYLSRSAVGSLRTIGAVAAHVGVSVVHCPGRATAAFIYKSLDVNAYRRGTQSRVGFREIAIIMPGAPLTIPGDIKQMSI